MIGIGVGMLGSGALLAALRAAHRQVEWAPGEIEATTINETPDLPRVSAFRLRIGQANLARGKIVQKVRRHLASRASKRDADALRDLERFERMHFQSVSELVRRWTRSGFSRIGRAIAKSRPRSGRIFANRSTARRLCSIRCWSGTRRVSIGRLWHARRTGQPQCVGRRRSAERFGEQGRNLVDRRGEQRGLTGDPRRNDAERDQRSLAPVFHDNEDRPTRLAGFGVAGGRDRSVRQHRRYAAAARHDNPLGPVAHGGIAGNLQRRAAARELGRLGEAGGAQPEPAQVIAKAAIEPCHDPVATARRSRSPRPGIVAGGDHGSARGMTWSVEAQPRADDRTTARCDMLGRNDITRPDQERGAQRIATKHLTKSAGPEMDRADWQWPDGLRLRRSSGQEQGPGGDKEQALHPPDKQATTRNRARRTESVSEEYAGTG